jgi:hypothetical protein
MTMLLSSVVGLMWGALAYRIEAAPLLVPALLRGACVGVVVAFVFRPLRDAEWPATAVLSLVGLVISVLLFGAFVGVGQVGLPQYSLAEAPLLVFAAMLAYLFGLVMTGGVLWLWPLAFVTHQAVWWLQRRDCRRAG